MAKNFRRTSPGKRSKGEAQGEEQEKGKAKVHEEDIFQDMPEFEVPQHMPEAPLRLLGYLYLIVALVETLAF